jgi:hypothetical protein
MDCQSSTSAHLDSSLIWPKHAVKAASLASSPQSNERNCFIDDWGPEVLNAEQRIASFATPIEGHSLRRRQTHPDA